MLNKRGGAQGGASAKEPKDLRQRTHASLATQERLFARADSGRLLAGARRAAVACAPHVERTPRRRARRRSGCTHRIENHRTGRPHCTRAAYSQHERIIQCQCARLGASTSPQLAGVAVVAAPYTQPFATGQSPSVPSNDTPAASHAVSSPVSLKKETRLEGIFLFFFNAKGR